MQVVSLITFHQSDSVPDTRSPLSLALRTHNHVLIIVSCHTDIRLLIWSGTWLDMEV